MFRRLKIKFISITSMAMLIVIFVVLGLVNFVTTFGMYQELDEAIDIIIENGGNFPNFRNFSKQSKGQDAVFSVTPESEYILRYFTVLVSDGEIEQINTEHIAAMSDEDVETVALQIAAKDVEGTKVVECSDRKYMYKMEAYDDDTDIIVFLDATDRLNNISELVEFSMIIGILSMGMFTLFVSILSKRAIKPMIDNIERQREFVTNAGHELKTPIAIISANTEVIEMMDGKNEWTDSIMAQVKRLSGLVNNLIRLARMEEKADIVLAKVDISAEVKDVAESMRPVIENASKTLETDIEEGIIVTAESNHFHELANILVDNAAKYCDDNGTVVVSLAQKGKQAVLNVSNTYRDAGEVDTKKFFERFYRRDESHNNKKQGYGIGLSMAEQIVRTFGGKISASAKDQEITFTVQLHA